MGKIWPTGSLELIIVKLLEYHRDLPAVPKEFVIKEPPPPPFQSDRNCPNETSKSTAEDFTLQLHSWL